MLRKIEKLDETIKETYLRQQEEFNEHLALEKVKKFARWEKMINNAPPTILWEEERSKRKNRSEPYF